MEIEQFLYVKKLKKELDVTKLSLRHSVIKEEEVTYC